MTGKRSDVDSVDSRTGHLVEIERPCDHVEIGDDEVKGQYVVSDLEVELNLLDLGDGSELGEQGASKLSTEIAFAVF